MTTPYGTGLERRARIWRVSLWVLIAAYTFVLPDAIVVYRAIVADFGQTAAGTVPLVIVILVGIAYVLAMLRSGRNWKNLFFLLPSLVIAVLIMKLVDNPNKHIHIPEYVLMAWLLFSVLSRDYRGQGIFVLVFVLAILLGVVDELEQGINPARFYGLSDMAVNSASALIGVFTIMGLRGWKGAGWAWTGRLKQHQILVGLVIFGSMTAVLMCACLFRVQARGRFWGVYPTWLLGCDILYLVLTAGVALVWAARRRRPLAPLSERWSDPAPEAVTARLWLVPLLMILSYMHSLVVFVAVSGVKFS